MGETHTGVNSFFKIVYSLYSHHPQRQVNTTIIAAAMGFIIKTRVTRLVLSRHFHHVLSRVWASRYSVKTHRECGCSVEELCQIVITPLPAVAVCPPLLGGGGDQGGASCALGQQLLGWRHVDGGLCYIQTLAPTSVPPTLSTHTAGNLGTAGDGRHWTKNRSGPSLSHVPPPPRLYPHPLATQFSANPHKDQSPSVK